MRYALILLLLIATGAVCLYLIDERHRIDGIKLQIEAEPWTDPAFADLSDGLRGEAAAKRVLQQGIRRLVIYGLIRNGSVSEIDAMLRPFGYLWLSGGCLVGDSKYVSGTAYNRIMEAAGREQFGEHFSIVVRSMML